LKIFSQGGLFVNTEFRIPEIRETPKALEPVKKNNGNGPVEQSTNENHPEFGKDKVELRFKVGLEISCTAESPKTSTAQSPKPSIRNIAIKLVTDFLRRLIGI
jgi:hypothetical protein